MRKYLVGYMYQIKSDEEITMIYGHDIIVLNNKLKSEDINITVEALQKAHNIEEDVVITMMVPLERVYV